MLEIFLGGHKWVYSMHIIVGPLLSLIAYLVYCHCFNGEYNEYKGVIKGLVITQIILGFVVMGYHGYKLAQNNGLI